MDSELVRRRDAAADRHDRALAAHPDRHDAALIRELDAVVKELRAVIAEAERRGTSDEELARAWAWLGAALYDRAAGEQRDILLESAAAYARGEALLDRSASPLTAAKLDFNFANTLRALSGGFDLALLREAKQRYERAVARFDEHARELTPQARAALGSLEVQIALATTYRDGQAAIRELEDMRHTLERDPGAEVAVRARLEALRSRVSPESARKDLETAAVRTLFLLLSQRLAGDAAATPERREHLSSLLARYEAAVLRKSDTLAAAQAVAVEMREIQGELLALLESPSLPGLAVPSGSRAGRIQRHLRGVKRLLAEEANRPMVAPEDARMARGYMVRAAELDTLLHERHADEAAVRAVALRARQLASEARRYLQRRHPMLVRPLFPRREVAEDPTLVAFAGGAGVEESTRTGCAALGLSVEGRATAGTSPSEPWYRLRRACVAVFDFTVEEGASRAQVAYELGLATALGRPVVVVMRRGERLFDVDLEPVVLPGGAGDATVLAEAIEAAVFASPRGWKAGSVSETARHAASLVGEGSSPELLVARRELLAAREDPAAFVASLRVLLGMLGSDAPELVFPPWPAAYPSADSPRCFHVTPFRPEWARRVSDVVHEACGTRVQYVRGDLPDRPEVIGSIWKEIATATHVVVDLTGRNANVALELALAHALGRRCLLLFQGQPESHLFPSIERLQARGYSLSNERALADTVAGFLGVSHEERTS